MGILAKSIVMGLAVLFFSVSSFGQTRLDVSIEGPWLLYVEPSFQTTSGTARVLVAIAPVVAGHNAPTFSTGDGGNIPGPGIYCVAFDGRCKPNNTTAFVTDGYPPNQLMSVSKPLNWSWVSYANSAYVLIMPVPDSFSNDGVYQMTFQSSFPVQTLPPPTTTDPGPHGIGVALHYAAGPQTVGLLGCTGAPSVATCGSSVTTNLVNYGTLRLTVKSIEDPFRPDIQCDYHVHLAYHTMLQLLDPTLTSNANHAFMDVPVYDTACTRCDPQQSTVAPDCAAITMNERTRYEAMPRVLSVAVASLVESVGKLDVSRDQKDKLLDDGVLPKLAAEMSGMIPSQSQLSRLQLTLEHSIGNINVLIAQLADNRSRNKDLIRDLEIAATKEQALINSASFLEVIFRGGKDCRAPVLLIQ